MRNQFVFKSLLFLFIITGQISFTNGQNSNKRPDSWSVKIENSYLENFWKLNDTLYRSEQPDKTDFIYLNSIGIKSILNLRSQHTDKESIGSLCITEYNVEMDAEKFSDNEIIEALKAIQISPKPILVHCRHGSDRTGVVIAMYRIIFQNWTKEQALLELQNGGYGFHTIYANIPDYINNVNVEKIKKIIIK